MIGHSINLISKNFGLALPVIMSELLLEGTCDRVVTSDTCDQQLGSHHLGNLYETFVYCVICIEKLLIDAWTGLYV